MAKKADNKFSFEEIMHSLRAGKYAPIYFLMGDEPYFIDRISDFIEQNALPLEERDMNQRVIYGKDTTMKEVLLEARQFPFLAERRVVIVKEAQNLKRDIDLLESYLANPPQTTVLVFCYKYDKLDKRKKFVKSIDTLGVLFSSETIYQDRVPAWIQQYCQAEGLKIDVQAAAVLAENIGADLLRISTEIDKIKILLDGKTQVIDLKVIEENVGISRNFNNFELVKALAYRNTPLVFKIIDYFGKSPKSFVLQQTLAVIHNYFVKLLYYHLIADKRNQDAVAQKLGVHRFFLGDYTTGARHFDYHKTRRILSEIRSIDARSKGFRSPAVADDALLKELCFMILE